MSQAEHPRQCRDLPFYLAVRFLSEAAAMVQSVAVGWMVYAQTHDPLALGIVGIVQFTPMLLLTLPAGELCDRISPRRVLTAALVLESVCAFAFIGLASALQTPIWAIYLALAIAGAARAFSNPASQSLLPLIVSPAHLSRAIASASTAWQVAVVAGPVLGGAAYAFGPNLAYGFCGAALLVSSAFAARLRDQTVVRQARSTLRERIVRIREGVAFIWTNPVVLGAISLDLFAVLLGGATALLPVYAKDILHVGPKGLGLLRAAPAIGAALSAFVQIRVPVDRRVGRALFGAVAIFGAATLIFALSKSFILSLIALLLMGASDMVSVNIRSTLVQFSTPDAMRGRVAAVNMLFVGASSELGAFESGVTAAILGTVSAVALGGIGTLAMAALWMLLFPSLRRADRLSVVGSD